MAQSQKGLSAGRVQSVALKIIIDREKKSASLYLKNTGVSMATLKSNEKVQGDFLGLDGKRKTTKR